MMNAANTSLWPAGHLPHKEGDRLAAGRPLPLKRFCDWNPPLGTQSVPHPFSPVVGEMPGRAEGGKPSLIAISQEAR
ncbi:hypothetical protein ATC00_26420 [Sinorhizobium americanum]|nr:hypothetical protein ATC00_26420 [Sinorhizobium americanum]